MSTFREEHDARGMAIETMAQLHLLMGVTKACPIDQCPFKKTACGVHQKVGGLIHDTEVSVLENHLWLCGWFDQMR